MFGFSAPLAAIMAIDVWTLPPSPTWLFLREVQGQYPVEDNIKKSNTSPEKTERLLSK